MFAGRHLQRQGRAYVKPVGALADGVGACLAQFGEVCRENGRCDDGGGRHGGGSAVIHVGWGRLQRTGE